MPRYTHILFDLDGTLIDSAPAILASFRNAFAEAGITPVVAIDESIIGPPLLETLQILSGSHDTATSVSGSESGIRACSPEPSPSARYSDG